jgi:hypothetical protein
LNPKAPVHELTNRDFCLYVLSEAGGDVEFVATEDIAVKAFELYPERFGLIKYPQYPDVDAVRVTLTDLRKDKYGRLVEGDKKRGWKITASGTAWIRRNGNRVREVLESRHPKERRISTGKRLTSEKIRAAFLDRILSSDGYRKWKKGQEPSIYDFYDLLRIDNYTPEPVYREHLNDLLAALPEGSDAKQFLAEMAASFGGRYRVSA